MPKSGPMTRDTYWWSSAYRFAGPLRCTGFRADKDGNPTELTVEYVHDLEGKKLKVCGSPD